jgi:hypothetical protein
MYSKHDVYNTPVATGEEDSYHSGNFHIYRTFDTTFLPDMHLLAYLAFLSTTLAAPLLQVESAATVVSGQYIVKIKQNEVSAAENGISALTQSLSTPPKFEYSLDGFRGFAGQLSDTELDKLRASKYVREAEIEDRRSCFNTRAGRVYPARHGDTCIQLGMSRPCYLGPQSRLAQGTWKLHVYLRRQCRRRHLCLCHRLWYPCRSSRL